MRQIRIIYLGGIEQCILCHKVFLLSTKRASSTEFGQDVPAAQSAGRWLAIFVLAIEPTASCLCAKAFEMLHLFPTAFVFRCHIHLYGGHPEPLV